MLVLPSRLIASRLLPSESTPSGLIASGCLLLIIAALPRISSAQSTEQLAEPTDQVQTSPVIPIYGRKVRSTESSAVGKEVKLRPLGASRYEPRNELNREPSVEVIETGRISSAGFVVPRSRGHDARLTQVFVGGINLQDPYSGLPLVDDLDLRTFGELRFFQGVSPFDLPTTQPVGVLQYRWQQDRPAGVTLGSELGRPYGWSLFVEARGKFATRGGLVGAKTSLSSEQPSAASSNQSPGTVAWGVFSRIHQTGGKFVYYNDNGTPFNDSDDTLRTRSNNFRASRTFIPTLEWRFSSGLLRGLAIFQRSHTGLPAPDDSFPTAAAERGLLTMGLVTYRYGDDMVQGTKPEVTTEVTYSHTLRGLINDTVPAAQGSAGTYRISADRLQVLSSWSAAFDAKLDGILSRSRISDQSDDDQGGKARSSQVQRDGLRLHLGLGKNFWSKLRLELKFAGSTKATVIDQQGPTDLVEPAAASPSPGWLHGLNTSATYDLHAGKAYLQWAFHERGPSILEEFGNGMAIRGNPTLRPETYLHHEVGLMGKSSPYSWGLSLFHDEVSNKIAFLPSLLGTERAQNIRRVISTGLDGQFAWRWQSFEVVTAAAYIRALDLRSGAPDQPLVGVPRQRLTVTSSYGFGDIIGRLISRYESVAYRDRAASRVVPAYTVHDLSIDMRHEWQHQELGLGLYCHNLLNVSKLPIAAQDTEGSTGFTSYGDVKGYPLPGRHWKVTATVSF